MHCHVPMTLVRGYGEGLPLNRWLSEKYGHLNTFLQMKIVITDHC